MNILFDGVVFERNGLGGVARYVTETIRALRRQSGVNAALTVSPAARTPPVGMGYSRERSIRAVCQMLRAEIFHSTYYRVWPSMRRKPMVSTVYDWVDASFPMLECNPGDFAGRQKNAIARSAGVIAISEDTKRRTMEFAGIPEDRIVVAYPGLSGVFLEQPPGQVEVEGFRERVTGGAPYLLHVGNRLQYKNFHLVLKAFLAVAGRTDRHLVVVGGERRFPDEWIYEVFQSGFADRVHFLKRPSDADLRLAYMASDAYVSASYMEGFGIPVIEALSCGTVPVISDIPVYREIAEGFAMFVPPTSQGAWEEAFVGEFKRDPCAREHVLGTFTWAATARAHIEMYRRFA